MKITTKEIADILSITSSVQESYITDLLTDSRSLGNPVHTLFFAIPTQGNDGHRYVASLYEKGVRNFVVNKIPVSLSEKNDINWFVVENTISALQKIASRKHPFTNEILAITGSRGKTTLKEWIYQLLEPFANISRSPRSYNSQIGVPLSMWQINQASSLAIIEAGISQSGEMKKLADCIQPDCVIITNIDTPHSQGFESLKQKAEEKALLAATDSTKDIIFCKDYPLIADAVSCYKESKNLFSWSFTDPDATLFIRKKAASNGMCTFDYIYNNIESSLTAPLCSDEDYENAANALAFMLHRGICRKDISERFSKLHKIGTRLNVTEGVNHCSIILDSYTSDFSSLLPAVDFMRRRKTPSQTTTLILSDIHHESSTNEEVCKSIAAVVKQANISRFIGVGQIIYEHRELFGETAMFFKDVSDLMKSLSTSDFSDEIILLKGSQEFDLSVVAEMLETRKHETVLEVNLDSVVRNYNYFRSFIPASCGIVCMVKASGYGAGSYEIAKTLQDCGAAYLAVAVLDEGIDLRKQGITMPIMVMNPKVVNYKSMFANRLEPEIYSFDMLNDMILEAKKNGIKNYPVHIKLDTGMHRMGFIENELPRLMDILNKNDEICIRSAFSHLATADCPDMNDFTELQLTRFRKYTDYMLSVSKTPFLRHVLNSAGILRFPEHHYDMARLGIGLYGANTLPPEMEKPLATVSTLRTVIIAIREYEPGETVGYGRFGKIKRHSRIATLPIGYADGMNRHFGKGNISVMVNGQWAPTIGNICMDACMIDITGINCKIGDSVEIFGNNAPLQRLADTLDTIPYEVLTSVSPRVKRIYYRE